MLSEQRPGSRPRQTVSILTRPYGRMLSQHLAVQALMPWFQSSPALTGGCYVSGAQHLAVQALFQSSPALTGGCYTRAAYLFANRGVFQSSPALTGGCYFPPHEGERVTWFVSILTRPYGRMLSASAPRPGPGRAVSILTRPYGRMLWFTPPNHGGEKVFQSSPALTGGCYVQALMRTWTCRPCFNPHPPLRADAIRISAAARAW